MKAILLATIFVMMAEEVFAGPSVDEVIESAPRYDAPGPGYPGRGVRDVILYKAVTAEGYAAPREMMRAAEPNEPKQSINVEIRMSLQPSPGEKPALNPWNSSFLYTK